MGTAMHFLKGLVSVVVGTPVYFVVWVIRQIVDAATTAWRSKGFWRY